MRMLRQGDVLLVEVDDPPSGNEVAPESRGDRLEYVLARGEGTSHAHVLPASGGVMLRRHPDKGLFLRVRGSCIELRHEEHRPLPVPPGAYRIVRQRTYDAGRDRNVWSLVRD
jgi:hypothetical protein